MKKLFLLFSLLFSSFAYSTTNYIFISKEEIENNVELIYCDAFYQKSLRTWVCKNDLKNGEPKFLTKEDYVKTFLGENTTLLGYSLQRFVYKHQFEHNFTLYLKVKINK